MEQTFQEQYTEMQETTGDSSSESLSLFKRRINEGASKMIAQMGRYFTIEREYADLTADQFEYQLPENTRRPTLITVSSGGTRYPVEIIDAEDQWAWLQAGSQGSSSRPVFAHIRGRDVLEFNPAPSETVEDGIELSFEPRHRYMTQPDYTTGTATPTNGSAVVAGVGTSWGQAMIGRIFKVTGENNNELAYRISAVTSTTSLTLEGLYTGIGGAGQSYKIGEAALLPIEYAEAPMDYAYFRYYKKKGNRNRADEYQGLWEDALLTVKEQYASTTSSQIIPGRNYSRHGMPRYSPLYNTPGPVT